MPPKKNCRDNASMMERIPDSACEAYLDLRGHRLHAYGIDVLIRRGMLEWMLVFGNKSTEKAVMRGALGNPGPAGGEIVAILTNMMEDACHGA